MKTIDVCSSEGLGTPSLKEEKNISASREVSFVVLQQEVEGSGEEADEEQNGHV
ncbi:MAG: hypothetical protein ACT4TC_10880 [Myxococcaceae bacterium]